MKIVEKIVEGVILLAIVWICLTASGCQFTSGVGTAIKGLGADIENASDGYQAKTAEQAYQDGLNGVAYK